MSEQPLHPGDEGSAFPGMVHECWTAPDGGMGSADVLSPGLTLRQYAAIHLQVPDSGLPWLDAMIDRARRDRFAGRVAPELAAIAVRDAAAGKQPDDGMDWVEEFAFLCHGLADALIAKLGGE